MSGSAAPTSARFDYDLYFDLLLVSKKTEQEQPHLPVWISLL